MSYIQKQQSQTLYDTVRLVYSISVNRLQLTPALTLKFYAFTFKCLSSVVSAFQVAVHRKLRSTYLSPAADAKFILWRVQAVGS